MIENQQIQKRHSLRNFFITFTLIFAGLIIWIWWYGAGQGLLVEGPRMNRYLNEKYAQEFAIEDVYLSGDGLGVEGAWRAVAYPKSDPSLKFKVRNNSRGQVDFETFLETLWTKQGSDEVDAFLASEFPNNEGYYLRISPGNGPGNALYDSIQGQTPHLSSVLEQHKDKLSYNLSVRTGTGVISNEPSNDRLIDAFKVVNFAKNLGIHQTSAGYAYRNLSFTKKDNAGQQKYQYTIRVEGEDLKNIQTATELGKYFSPLEP